MNATFPTQTASQIATDLLNSSYSFYRQHWADNPRNQRKVAQGIQATIAFHSQMYDTVLEAAVGLVGIFIWLKRQEYQIALDLEFSGVPSTTPEPEAIAPTPEPELEPVEPEVVAPEPLVQVEQPTYRTDYSGWTLKQLRKEAERLEIEPEGDKRLKATWISALVTS